MLPFPKCGIRTGTGYDIPPYWKYIVFVEGPMMELK